MKAFFLTSPDSPARFLGYLALGVTVVFHLLAPVVHADDAIAPDTRLTVALLSFADKTGDPKSAHWRYSLPRGVGAPLREAKAIRIYPAEACDYGLRKLELKAGDPVNAVQAQQIGEIIEARRVVRGDYRRQGNKWTVTVHVMNVATGEESAALSATAGDWFDVCDQVAAKILQELGITPIVQTEAVRKRIRFTKSAAALEFYSQGYALQAEGKSYAEMERCSREAVAADPESAEMHIGLAGDLLSQGKQEEASQEIEEALRLKPESASAHVALGVMMAFQGKTEAAGKPFREALRLSPDDPSIHARMAEYHSSQGEWPQAVASIKESLRLNPVSAANRAKLACFYATQGDRTKALVELAQAEYLGLNDINDEQMAFQAYRRLHQIPQAVTHYEKFIALARAQGINPEKVNRFAQGLEKMKASLTPVFVSSTEPKSYSEESLHEALSAKLSPQELASINQPLASMPEMKRWAEELTKGAANDDEKARLLHDALAGHLDPGLGGSRTARETFADWQKPEASFRCQEYARLYVALARDVGLKAYFVMVEKDYENLTVLHACAGVFIEGKALLVDPSYRWFGVAHKQFSFQDDYQAVVNHLHQSRDLRLLRLAVKLQPDSALSQYNLAMQLMELKQMEEARQVLETALKLDSESWLADYAQGMIAMREGQPDLALVRFRKAVELNPQDTMVQYWFARTLGDRGLFKESRKAFRDCLKLSPSARQEADARHAIAVINEKIGPENALESAAAAPNLTDYIEPQFEAASWQPGVNYELGLMYDNRPEPNQLEIDLLTRQAAADPEDAASRFRLGTLLDHADRKEESDRRFKEAEGIYRKRLAADPNDLQGLTGLALCLRGTEEGGRLAKRATELAPAACEPWLALAQHQIHGLMIQACQGLENLPPGGFDRSRLDEALRLRALSEPESQAISERVREVLASCLKAIEVAPANPDPILRYLAIRNYMLQTQDILHRLRDEPTLDWVEDSRKAMGLMDQAASLCRDSPEKLGALTMMRFITARGLLPKDNNGAFDPDILKKRQEEVLAPALARLRELSDSPDAQTAAAACEAYGAVITFIPLVGGLPTPAADLPPMLHRAVRLAPNRCLAWDLLIHHANSKPGGSTSDESLPIALERAKELNTGRSHALVGLCSRENRASKPAWELAVKLEPENVEYLLNLAAVSLRLSQTKESRDAVSGLLDRVTDLWYDPKHGERYQKFSAFRLRIFAVNQAMAGDSEGARRTVAKILEAHPDDVQTQGLQAFLQDPQQPLSPKP